MQIIYFFLFIKNIEFHKRWSDLYIINFIIEISMEAGIRKEQQLYEQNQKLGYQINFLNDENNFYRISINNIKKLNNNINKRLANRPANSQTAALNLKNIAESYSAITNQIQLKNLQLKVGNMKRKVVQVQKIHQGSLSNLMKHSQLLQKQINILARELQYYTIENQLLDNIYFDDYVISKMAYDQKSMALCSSVKITSFVNQNKSRNLKIRQSYRQNLSILEKQQSKQSNKLQKVFNEQKQIKYLNAYLKQKINALNEERQRFASQVYDKNFNIRVSYANEMNRLKIYGKKERELLEEIKKQDLLLEEQYKTNQEYKQKIMDRNEVEMKDIKSLHDKIKKRNEELREIKQKLENLQLNKVKSTINLK